MDENCLFCKIGAKKIPAKIVYEDDDVFAFEDISPQAPTHILICPRKHFAALHETSHGYKWWRRSWRRSGICSRDIAQFLTMAAGRDNRCFICISICWVGGIFAGHRDKSGPRGTGAPAGALAMQRQTHLSRT